MIRATFNHKKIIKNEYYNKILLFQPHQEDIDMQAVISERRSLEILKRSLPSEDARDSEGAFSRKPSTAESLDSYVSVDESHSPASKSPVPGTGFGTEGYPHRVPTIECEEPSIEEDENSSERRHLKVGGQDTNRLSLDRSRSDETGSWMTVECDEFIGSDTSDNEPRTLEPDRNVLETQATLEDANPLEYSNCATPTSDLNILLTPPNASPQIEKSVLETFEKYTGSSDTGKKKNTLDKQSDRSKSSDSWTSGEKDTSPQRQQDWSLSVGKEKSSVEEESSVSCSIARPLGISQDFGKEEARKCQELKQRMLQLEVGKEEITPTPSNEQTPTNEPKILVSKKPSTPTLEKQSPIDLGTSTESYLEPIEERIAKILDRGGARTEDSESSSGGSRKPPRIEKPARANAGKKLSVTRADAGKSGSDRSSQESKSSFDSKGSLSVESRGSFETESSSGSLGAAQRRGELAQKEQQSTWRPFPIESSNSSSTDDPWHHVETDGGYERYDAQNPLRDSSDSDVKEASPDDQKDASDASYQDELNDFPATFGYPAMTSSLGGIGVNPTDIIGYSTGFTLGRTLSRISERSTASEKSSMEDDVSKASTHSVSMRDESVGSTDHQPSLSSDRSKGHAPILFAHARLNLSEGSVSLQRQKATQQQSPTTERRTKSLDTPVISLHRLPPMNAFSSKDDTVGFEEEAEILEEKSLERENQATAQDEDTADSIHSCAGSIPTQSSYQTNGRDSLLSAVSIDTEEAELLNQLRYIEKIALQGVKIKDKKKSKMKLRSGDHLILNIPKYRFTDWSPYSSANSSRKTSPGVSRASSIESTGKGKLKTSEPYKGKPVSRSRPESRRTSADDIKARDGRGSKKSSPKERPRSIEMRRLSKDKSKSQEETEADIAKRKERQQKLYESAMKQTITMLSPVKDTLPAFPAPGDKILVKTDGDKIIIETEFKSKAEDHVLIAKSPRKLDNSLVKFSRSFDEGRSPDKLDKANRSFEDRNKSFEDSEKSDAPEDMLIKSPKKIAKAQELKQKIEGSVVHKKIDGKSSSLERPAEHHYLGPDVKARSLDDKRQATEAAKKNEEKPAPVVRSAIGDRRMFAHQYQVQEVSNNIILFDF